jgi:manganese-dependent inorganic pyrophosphatase
MNQSKEIKVFGHRSPDTDATASAIVWSWFLNEHRKQAARPYVLGDINTEADFVLESWGVTQPLILSEITADDEVAIVDTNNLDELFQNINDAKIISVIDHHKLSGNLKTNHPPEIVIQPYASTMTVMYNVMNIEVENFPRDIAGLMLSGILSDTLEFRSPTSTEDDKILAKKLSTHLGIDMHDYAMKMFDAKSAISHLSAEELLRMDSKIFEIKDLTMRISVLETTNPAFVLEKYNDIVSSIPKIKEEDSVDMVLFFVIDILNENATLFVPDEETKEIAEKSFGVSINDKKIILPGIVSRKKQILPALLK